MQAKPRQIGTFRVGLPKEGWYRLAVWAALLVLARLGLSAALAHGHLASALCKWDCHWYVIVADHGYDPVLRLMRGHYQPDWAFFPLLPALMRVLATLTGLSPAAAGLIVSSVSLWGFAVLGAAYLGRTRPDADRWAWLLLLLAWPYGVYFQAPYTESLFALIATSCLLAGHLGMVWRSALACGLLTATRPNAVLLLAWVAARSAQRALCAPSAAASLRAVVPAALAPVGLVAFMLVLWGRLGDPLAFLHAQGAWGHTFRNPAAVMASAVTMARSGHLGLLYNAGWAVAGLAVSAFAVARGRGAEAWLCAGTVALALSSGSLWSMPRYVAGNPAFLFAASDGLCVIRSRTVRGGLLLAGLTVQIIFLLDWFREAAFLV